MKAKGKIRPSLAIIEVIRAQLNASVRGRARYRSNNEIYEKPPTDVSRKWLWLSFLTTDEVPFELTRVTDWMIFSQGNNSKYYIPSFRSGIWSDHRCDVHQIHSKKGTFKPGLNLMLTLPMHPPPRSFHDPLSKKRHCRYRVRD